MRVLSYYLRIDVNFLLVILFKRFWEYVIFQLNGNECLFVKKKKRKEKVIECFIDKKKKFCLLIDCRLFLFRCNVRNVRNRLVSQIGMCSILLFVRFNIWRYIRFLRFLILGIRLYDRFRFFSFRYLFSFLIFLIMLLLRLSCCSFFSLFRFFMYCK